MRNLLYKESEIVTNKLSSDTTVYCIQFIACTCPISEGAKRKILRCYKSLKQKEIATKKRKSYAELEPVKKKQQKLCFERFCQYYNNVKNKKKDCKDLYSCITCFQKKSKGPDDRKNKDHHLLFQMNTLP